MAEHTWKKFKTMMKEKRVGKKSGKDKETKEIRSEITVQRLSSEVTGKVQKYSRIGPREFVQLGGGDEEMTIKNIQESCLKHFQPQIGSGFSCDILAGEQGPSCTMLKQIPDMKLIYVRFIYDITMPIPVSPPKRDYASTSYSSDYTRQYSLPSPKKTKVTSMVPKSLSVTHMLKLGKVLKKASTIIDVYQFDLSHMTWSTIPKPVEFNVSEDLLGEGGFRKAYKAKSSNKDFSDITWVLKEYKQCALDVIAETQQTVEAHTKKVVQMLCLAQNFASQCKVKIEKDGLAQSFGDTLQYANVYMGKRGEHFVTIEEYFEGNFEKFINNDGTICKCKNDIVSAKAECLAHYSYEKSNHELMLVDIQGCDHKLFDPEIASSTLLSDENEVLFTTGNLSNEAIGNFLTKHKCNSYCSQLQLKCI